MQTDLEIPKTYEPSKSNRFLIHFEDLPEIHSWLFRSYKIYNDGDILYFETEFYEILNYMFNPKDFFKITKVKIDNLDPTGVSFGNMSFEIKGSNYERTCDYGNDGLLINKFKFIIDTPTIITTFTPVKYQEITNEKPKVDE